MKTEKTTTSLDDYPLTFRRVEKPSEDLCIALRRVIVGVVLDQDRSKPIHVNRILALTKQRLQEKEDDQWLFPEELRRVGNLNIRRRTNDCADNRRWRGKPAPLVHVGHPQSPFYALNPERFPEVTR